MFKKLNRLFNYNRKFEKVYQELASSKKAVLENRLSIGKLLRNQNLDRVDIILDDINKSEFSIYSQFGDDGIIQFLINYLDIADKKFVEFGVENYTECNTRFLLVNDNWSGLIMDGSTENMNSVKNDDIYWRHDLTAVGTFVTAENINQILIENKFTDEIGLLHIDIDGNDYWIWKEVSAVNPVIAIIEYNSLFGYDKPWTIPYDPSFYRKNRHYSNLYYGTSLLSICDLANEKGYSFIGCNTNGNNAFFVRNDKLKSLKVKQPKEGYSLSKFAESRNLKGELTFLRGEERLKLLKGLSIYNTRTNQLETIV